VNAEDEAYASELINVLQDIRDQLKAGNRIALAAKRFELPNGGQATHLIYDSQGALIPEIANTLGLEPFKPIAPDFRYGNPGQRPEVS